MKSITFRDKKIEVPECLDELTPAQYGYFVRLGSWLAGGLIDLETWRARWFSYLAGMGASIYTILKPEYIEQAAPMVDDVTSPFLALTDKGMQPVYNTCKNLLPSYGGYSGPKDWLDDVSYAKFVECSTLLELAREADDPIEIYEEIARALYAIPEDRPVPELLAWHAPVLFGSVWHAIQSGPVEINGRQIDFSIIFKSTGQRRPDDKTGWAGISFEVASTGIFGNIKELDSQPFWTVLMYLYKCKFEYLNEKRNTPVK